MKLAGSAQPLQPIAVLVMFLGLAAGACTTLLGDDFTIGAGGGGSSSGTGGSSSGTGGGGGAAPLPYACQWEQASHTTLTTILMEDNTSWEELHAVRRGEGLSVVTQLNAPTGTVVENRRVESSPDPWTWSFPADRLFGAARLGSNSYAILYLAGAGADRWLEIKVVPDSDFDGSNVITHALTDPAMLADWCSGNGNMQAVVAPTPDAGAGNLDIFISYPSSDVGCQFVERYGHYDGETPVQLVTINEATPVLDENDARIADIMHEAGVTHVFLGEPGAPQGPRSYALDPSIGGPIPARKLGGPTDTWVAIARRNDGANVSFANLETSARLRAGKIPLADVATFDPAALPLAAEWPGIGGMPVDRAALRWAGDMLVMLGTKPLGDKTELSYVFVDVAGWLRGEAPLPFQGESVGTRQQIEGVVLTPTDNLFDTVGGRLNVVWVETQDPVAGIPEQVMYFDRLACYPSEPAG